MSIATTAKQEQHSAPGTATRDAGMVKWAQPGAKAAAMQRRPALCQPFDGIVHLDKELVERLFALVVSAAHAGSAVASNRVNFINEDDGGCRALGSLEQIAHAGSANANKHLNKVRTGN